MTGEEWAASDDAFLMLRAHARGVNRRRLRLFACACCRHFWDHFQREPSRRAVEVAERFADGRATEEERKSAFDDARRACDPHFPELAHLATFSVAEDGNFDLTRLTAHAAHAVAEWLDEIGHGERYRELADLLRDIVGNPWGNAGIAPPWLAWNDGFIPRFAQTIYDDRAFDQLPILADALEDAGCADDALLSHLRGPGPHVRGCWALDLILGRE
jgi:hypothetical protein